MYNGWEVIYEYESENGCKIVKAKGAKFGLKAYTKIIYMFYRLPVEGYQFIWQ